MADKVQYREKPTYAVDVAAYLSLFFSPDELQALTFYELELDFFAYVRSSKLQVPFDASSIALAWRQTKQREGECTLWWKPAGAKHAIPRGAMVQQLTQEDFLIHQDVQYEH